MYSQTISIYDALKGDSTLKGFLSGGPSEISPDGELPCSEVRLEFELPNGGSYRLQLINEDDETDTTVLVRGLIAPPEDETAKQRLLKALNDFNCRYRYLRFSMDQNGVNIDYDYPAAGCEPAQTAVFMVIRFVKIIEEIFPELMRAIWI